MKRTLLAVFCLLCVLGLAQGVFAQTATTGQILGVVKDPTGAVVPGAKLALTSAAGQVRESSSDAEGRYRFVLLAPGSYKVVAQATGFKTLTLDYVNVALTQTTVLDLDLGVAAAAEKIEVSAAPPLVDTSNPTTGRVIGETQITQAPLPTRNFQQLLALSPGAVAAVSNNTEMGRGDVNIDVNGQRSTSNNVVMDGMPINSPGTNATPNLSVPSPDAIQEFIVQTSLYDASQGRNSGGNVAVVTKSGTNAFHGDAFEFLRNDSLNANDYFLKKAGRGRPTYKRNQFGGTLGGPIIKDKTFFFVSYQGTRERNGTSKTNSLMTMNLPSVLSDARSTTAGQNAIAQAFLGPAATWASVNAVAQKLLLAKLPNGQWAIPNAAVAGTTALPVSTPISGISRFTEDQFIVNIDHSLSQKNKLSGKFFFADAPQYQAAFTFQGSNAFQAPGYGGSIDFHNRVLSISDTHIFSPSLLNQFHAGYSRIYGPSSPEEPFQASDFGITNPLCAGNPRFCGMPTIGVTGYFAIGSAALGSDQKSVVQTFEFGDMLSWTKGRHLIRVGGDVVRYHMDLMFNFYSRGSITFNTFTDFLRGTGVTGVLGAGVRDRGNRATDMNMYFQDDIRVSDRLTLNLGMRVERDGGVSEIRNRFVNFDPAAFAALGRNCTVLAPCAPPNGFYNTGSLNPADWNPAPRVGFSWRPLKDDTGLVVRAGFGVYFDRISSRFANVQVFNYPYDIVGVNVFGTFANPFPAALAGMTFPISPAPVPSPVILIPAIPPFFPVATPLPISGIYVDPKLRTPYVYQYNLGVQKEVAKGLLLEIGYVGSKGTKLLNMYVFNQGALGTAPYNLSGFSNGKIPTAGFHQVRSNAISHYDSLQASLTRRVGHGLQFLAAYTWSRSSDNNSAGPGTDLGTGIAGDQQKPATQRALSDFDRRHRFVFSGVYDLPKFYGGDSGLLKRTANGWQLATVTVFQTGSPFSVICSSSTTTLNRADFLPGATAATAGLGGSVASHLDGYFNTAAFAATPTSVMTCANAAPYGTSPRNFLRGPNQRNVDLSIVKFIPVTERTKLEFRTEFFNAFNFTNFANPISAFASGTTPTSSGLGKIISTSTGPRVIQFAMKVSF